ncbi:hypothetical protein GQ53DRAFT_396142 [Thozetella sp. PMI_491]|nr:hypothetical protein GQ53DRAFT_396142 [Thozetella sp. PMI_491]
MPAEASWAYRSHVRRAHCLCRVWRVACVPEVCCTASPYDGAAQRHTKTFSSLLVGLSIAFPDCPWPLFAPPPPARTVPPSHLCYLTRERRTAAAQSKSGLGRHTRLDHPSPKAGQVGSQPDQGRTRSSSCLQSRLRGWSPTWGLQLPASYMSSRSPYIAPAFLSGCTTTTHRLPHRPLGEQSNITRYQKRTWLGIASGLCRPGRLLSPAPATIGLSDAGLLFTTRLAQSLARPRCSRTLLKTRHHHQGPDHPQLPTRKTSAICTRGLGTR